MLRSTTDPEFIRDTEAYVVGFHEGHAAAIETEERPSTPAGGGGRRPVWAALIVAVGLVAAGWLARSPAPHTTTQTVDQVVDMGEYEDPGKAAQRSRVDRPKVDGQPVEAPVQDDPAPPSPQSGAAPEPDAVQAESAPEPEPAPQPTAPAPTTPPPVPEPPAETEPPQEEPAEEEGGLLTPVVEVVDGVLELVGLGGGG